MDKLELLLDMTEHPECYTEEQITQLLAEEDVRKHYEMMVRLRETLGGNKKVRRTPFPLYRKIAAVFVGVLLMTGLVFAVMRIRHNDSLNPHHAPTEQPMPTDTNKVAEAVLFDNVPLDSILTAVATHYKHKLNLDKGKTAAMRLTTVWNPARPLAEFVETLNEFNGLNLSVRNDTLFVDFVVKEEQK